MSSTSQSNLIVRLHATCRCVLFAQIGGGDGGGRLGGGGSGGGVVELTAKEAGKAESMATGEERTVD